MDTLWKQPSCHGRTGKSPIWLWRGPPTQSLALCSVVAHLSYLQGDKLTWNKLWLWFHLAKRTFSLTRNKLLWSFTCASLYLETYLLLIPHCRLRNQSELYFIVSDILGVKEFKKCDQCNTKCNALNNIKPFIWSEWSASVNFNFNFISVFTVKWNKLSACLGHNYGQPWGWSTLVLSKCFQWDLVQDSLVAGLKQSMFPFFNHSSAF